MNEATKSQVARARPASGRRVSASNFMGKGFQSPPTSANSDPHSGGKKFLHSAFGKEKPQVRTGYVRNALLCRCEIFRVTSH